MTIDELIKELPFSIPTECRNKEELITAMEKHFKLLAVKAELLNKRELTAALDTARKYARKFLMEEITSQEKKENSAAWATIKSYIDRYTPEWEEEREDLKDQVSVALQQANDVYKEYKKAMDEARSIEREYREKYGEMSGRMDNETYYDIDSEREDNF